MKDRERIRERLVSRLLFLRFFFLLLFLVCIGGSIWLQILNHSYYYRLSLRNTYRKIKVAAPRGEIYDRKGRVLAETRAVFSVAIIKEFSENVEESLRRLSLLFNIPLHILKERFNRFSSYPSFKPLVLVDNLDIKKVSFFEAREFRWPEFMVIAEPVRYYPHGKLVAHVVGYVGEASQRELLRFPYLSMGDIVGKKGVERYYDRLLRGKEGEKTVEVDSLGRVLGVVKEKRPEKGASLILTIDLDLQRKAYSLLKGRKGAIVLMDARDGSLLALASNPSFDPNLFSSRFERTQLLKLLADPDKPLFTRAIQGTYPTGSTFKPVVALAGLCSGAVKADYTVVCRGVFPFAGKVFRCWQPGGHGKVDLVKAIEKSCNVYFYNLGLLVGPERIAEMARRLGLGSRTGVDLVGEASGLVPSPEWKRKAIGSQWFEGETLSFAIGQSYLKATPIQLAVLAAAIGNRGWYPVPHVLLCWEKGGKRKCYRVKRRQTGLDRNCFEKVVEGMRRAVNGEGTARRAKVVGVQVCGKTGTAQVVSLESSKRVKPHSLFIGFAPCEKPEVAVAVVVENAGAGGQVAAPVAGEMLNFYFRRK